MPERANEVLLTVIESANMLDSELALLQADLRETQRHAIRLEVELEMLCDKLYSLQGGEEATA